MSVARELAQLIECAPLVVCLGPGGVGKTTLSSVLALRQAAAGRCALVLTIDPARRLADALGIACLTNDPLEVTGFRKMHPAGSLSALMLDPTATFDHLISLLVSEPRRKEALLANHFYQHMSRSLAGTLEYMAVERLHELRASGQYETIVLDTPPTTNAIDFLEAPERLATFFSERVTRWFSRREQRAGLAARLVNRAGATLLALLARMAGQEFVEETVGFFSAFQDLLDSFRRRGVEVGKLLRDPRTVFLIICSADEDRLEEACELDRRLAGARCRAHGFIVNCVDESFLPEGSEQERALAQATLLLGGEGERARVCNFLERLEAHRRSHEQIAASHARVVDKLRRAVSPRPVFTAPRVPGGLSPRASLLALYLGLFAETADAISGAETIAEHQAVARKSGLPYGRRATDV